MKIAQVKKTIQYLLGAFVVVIAMASCEYEKIEFELPDENEPVSFAADIVPIFTEGNNCTSCHGFGGTAPNLTAADAYNSIVPNLVNTENEEQSKIYSVPAGSHFKRYTPVQAANVLSWIKQGAENN